MTEIEELKEKIEEDMKKLTYGDISDNTERFIRYEKNKKRLEELEND